MPTALPGQSSSTPPSTSRTGGLLRVVDNDQLAQQEAARVKLLDAGRAPAPPPDIGSYIRGMWTMFRNHRNTGNDPLNQRLLRSQRMFEGKYDPDKLNEITKFGGSQVYSRLVAVKCRGATSLLRDVYLGADRPWDIQPEPDPPIPSEVRANVLQLVSTEAQTMQAAGTPVMPEQTSNRISGLMHAAQQAALRNATQRAVDTSDKIEDVLEQGLFYQALTEFLTDLPMFPFACLKGPVVRMVPMMVWTNGKASIQVKPRMFWERVSPFDIYWTPGVSRIEDADIIQRKRLTRSDLNDLLGVPGYDDNAIRMALEDYANGLREWLDAPDTEQALNEGRESPGMNQSKMIDCIEFHGNVQGRTLMTYPGIDADMVPDLDRDYSVTSWVVGRHTIKTQFNPSPRQRHPYFVTSFEKVPGTVSGHGLPDLLEDIQEIANASLRSLCNNMAIASGPQVVVNDESLGPTEDGNELYPWKRWHVQSDPMGQSGPPITFFQPQSNAQELLSVYQAITEIADEISAIPRYVTGNNPGGGAGRTASGLSMLMNNAQKILQTVASNVDMDVMQGLLQALYDMIMLTDTTGMLSGQEQIRVRGVNVAVQRETERQKQLQFLQITANPIDAPIVGVMGRARVLRSIASSLGLPDDVVPDDRTLQAQQDAQKQAAAAQGAGGPQGEPLPGQPPKPPPGPPGKGGPPPPHQGPSPGSPSSPSAGALASGSQPPQAGPPSLSDHAPPMNSFQQGLPHNV